MSDNNYPKNVKVKEHIWFLSKNYSAITLWPMKIYIKKKFEYKINAIINHENIHWQQQRELPILFYVLYILEYLIKLLFYQSKAYRNLAAEREAYYFQKNSKEYLKTRKRYSWLKYIFINPFKK